jgi:hypothetical protein
MLIVTHTIYLKHEKTESAISIKIERPRKRKKNWACRYTIDWPEGARTFEAIGFDALQALVLALKMIGSEIYASNYHHEGRLHAYDHEKGYGFPVASSLTDLLVGIDRI